MKCPYCNKEMQSGYLKSSHHISWGDSKGSGYLPTDIKLSSFNLESFIKGFAINSYCCYECKKIILSFDDE